MAAPSRFVYIVDRYLEVSNVYHQRMQNDSTTKKESSHLKERMAKLLGLVEGVSTQASVKNVKVIAEGSEKGQIVAPTPEFLANIESRQEDVLRRLNCMPEAGQVPKNLLRLQALLKLDPRAFLGSFPTPSYASDVLAELASLSVCPDVRILAARDMIHMHSVELQLHLVRVIAQAKVLSGTDEVPINCSLPVEQLHAMANDGSLVEKLVELSVSREPNELFSELNRLIDRPEAAVGWIAQNQDEVLKRVVQESRAFPDTLQELQGPEGALRQCESLVLFGLVATYGAWFSCAFGNREEMASFRTNILFCTRILLDEQRWWLCREFAKFAIDAIRVLNDVTGSDPKQGTGMINANLFFARRMCGEELGAIRSEIERWDIDELHSRYHFLKAILLEDFDTAAKLAISLLEPSDDTGGPDMSVEELEEWPILHKFRESSRGQEVLERLR